MYHYDLNSLNDCEQLAQDVAAMCGVSLDSDELNHVSGLLYFDPDNGAVYLYRMARACGRLQDVAPVINWVLEQ